MSRIADVLAVPLPEVVEAMWRETAGEPCPCGCGGTNVFPEERPEARTLAIEILASNVDLNGFTNAGRKVAIENFAIHAPRPLNG
jgi:hypothetical protein